MKILSFLIGFAGILLFISCGGGKHNHSGHHMENADTDNGNQVLYNQIMDIHDEVMPKTENIFNKTKELKSKLQEATTEDEKKDLQTRIAYLDSVNRMMMDWMHEFRPLPDSVSEENTRAYYETHLEKVKKVKEAIVTALDKEN